MLYKNIESARKGKKYLPSGTNQNLAMNIRIPILLIFFLNAVSARATWSIILVDSATGEIGIAGASCSHGVHGIGGIVPGNGAIVAQAMSNMKAKGKGLEMIRSGFSPDSILYTIIDAGFDPNYSSQQYGIVCLNSHDRPTTFTGGMISKSCGSFTAKGIAVLGNSLAGDQVLKAVFDTVMSARKRGLTIKETLMKALQAGSIEGGDARCGKQKASSAFITVVKPNDRINNPYFNLWVSGTPGKGNNAVDVLEKMYQRWTKKIARGFSVTACLRLRSCQKKSPACEPSHETSSRGQTLAGKAQ